MSMNAKVIGFSLALAGLVIVSPDAGLTSFVDMEIWSLVFWRGVGLTTTLGLLAATVMGPALLGYFRGLTWHAWAIIPLYGFVPTMWILGVKYAGGAQVLAVLAIAPLAASFFSRIFLGEAIRRSTMVASFVAMLGVGVVVSQAWFGNTKGADQHPLYLVGVLCSLVIPVFFALVMTFTRKVQRENMWPLFALSGLVMIALGGLFAPAIVWPQAGSQALALITLVFILGAFGTIFLTAAARFIPSADVTLIVMLEPVLGVVFLWLLVQEVPTIFQWVGGSIVFSTVAIYSVYQIAKDGHPRP